MAGRDVDSTISAIQNTEINGGPEEMGHWVGVYCDVLHCLFVWGS